MGAAEEGGVRPAAQGRGTPKQQPDPQHGPGAAPVSAPAPAPAFIEEKGRASQNLPDACGDTGTAPGPLAEAACQR